MENANFEQKLEKKRKTIEEKILELKEEKYETMAKLKELITDIDNLNIEVEVLSNYDKFINLTEKFKLKFERQDSPDKSQKRLTKKVTMDFELLAHFRSKVIVNEK